jgi:hypothetical protein
MTLPNLAFTVKDELCEWERGSSSAEDEDESDLETVVFWPSCL